MSVPPGQGEHTGTSRHGLSRLLEQFLEFRPGRGALPNDAVPAGLIRLRHVRTRRRAFEFDRLDPGAGLTADLPLIRLPNSATTAPSPRAAALARTPLSAALTR